LGINVTDNIYRIFIIFLVLLTLNLKAIHNPGSLSEAETPTFHLNPTVEPRHALALQNIMLWLYKIRTLALLQNISFAYTITVQIYTLFQNYLKIKNQAGD
jgi:hypothetical protein